MDGNRYLDAQLARELLFKLGEGLAAKNVTAEIALYGGSSLLFTIDGRQSTKDIDYLNISENNNDLEQIAVEIGEEYGLSGNWFADVTEVIASENPEYSFLGDFPPEKPGLRVFTATPEYVLAMKMKSPRSSFEGNDIKDIWLLLEHCGISNADKAIEWFDKFFPSDKLSQRDVAILNDIIASQQAGEEYSPMIGW